MSPQFIRRPKPTFKGQPRMVLGFGRSSRLPNNLFHARLHKAKELQLICGGRRVFFIGGELPSNIILHVLVKMHTLDAGPKMHELG
jgi:hypothetical protein